MPLYIFIDDYENDFHFAKHKDSCFYLAVVAGIHVYTVQRWRFTNVAILTCWCRKDG